MIEICNRGDFIKAQTYRSVFVCRSCGQADHPAERRAVRTYEQRTTIRYQVSEISAFYPDCW